MPGERRALLDLGLPLRYRVTIVQLICELLRETGKRPGGYQKRRSPTGRTRNSRRPSGTSKDLDASDPATVLLADALDRRVGGSGTPQDGTFGDDWSAEASV